MLGMKNLFKQKSKQILMTSLSFVVLTVLFAFITYETTKKSVTLDADGQILHYGTHAPTVAALLKSKNIHPNQHDKINPGLNAAVKDNMKISIKRAKQVNVSFNNSKKNYWTTADTVHDFLAEKGIKVNQHDRVLPDLDSTINNKMNITYDSSFTVDIDVGGKKSKMWTTSTTVADFLKKYDIKLGKDDSVQPNVDQPVIEGTEITVTRIKKVIDVVEAPVDFDTITKKDSHLTKGQKKVVASGEKGKVEKRYEVIYKNGKKVSSKLIDTKTIKESKNRIVALGTQTYNVSRSNGGSSKSIRVYSTAYTAYCKGCTGQTSYHHINLRENPDAKVIAVDPNVIPLGSKVYVPGYGYAIAADTGAAIQGNRIDIFTSSKSTARNWGARYVTVKILD